MRLSPTETGSIGECRNAGRYRPIRLSYFYPRIDILKVGIQFQMGRFRDNSDFFFNSRFSLGVICMCEAGLGQVIPFIRAQPGESNEEVLRTRLTT